MRVKREVSGNKYGEWVVRVHRGQVTVSVTGCVFVDYLTSPKLDRRAWLGWCLWSPKFSSLRLRRKPPSIRSRSHHRGSSGLWTEEDTTTRQSEWTTKTRFYWRVLTVPKTPELFYIVFSLTLLLSGRCTPEESNRNPPLQYSTSETPPWSVDSRRVRGSGSVDDESNDILLQCGHPLLPSPMGPVSHPQERDVVVSIGVYRTRTCDTRESIKDSPT